MAGPTFILEKHMTRRTGIDHQNDRRFTFWLPAEMHSLVKIEAAKRGTTIKDLLIKAIRREIKRGAKASDS